MAVPHAITDITRQIADRAIHLRIYPRPQTLSESREVLRVLQGFGEVEMFKSLKYDAIPQNSTALAIFNDAEAARRVLRASPLRYTLEFVDGAETQTKLETRSHPDTAEEQPGQDVKKDEENTAMAETRTSRSDTSTPSSFPTQTAWGTTQPPNTAQTRALHTARKPSLLFPTPSSATPPPPRHFTIQANFSRYHHRDKINSAAYHGSFRVNSKSAIQQDLASRVPLLGLSDCELKRVGKPWRIVERERREEGERGLRGLVGGREKG
ncbi:hypothetical protein LTR50_003912 [Elasticomyces elasticus]|nr:hypothetical protein LTR50_003912 [Elasticomyces elasticus]